MKKVRRFINGARKRGRPTILILIALLALGLTACDFGEPLPTPTPTRTPILPTATPTPSPTPTATPTPTPTLPPGLLLPPTPTTPEELPSLPADLYFVREGMLWLWLAEGGTLQQITPAESAKSTEILDYRSTANGTALFYVTAAGELYLFDRVKWEHTFIPTAGRLIGAQGLHFEVTPSGEKLLYLAWDVRPTAGSRSPGPSAAAWITDAFGTLLAIDVQDVRQVQQVLGLCEGNAERPCSAFRLNPAGTTIAYLDAGGIWFSQLTEAQDPAPQLFASYPEESDVVWELLEWSPDSRWLLVKKRAGEKSQRLLLDSEQGILHEVPHTTCEDPNCRVEAAWGGAHQGLWIAQDLPARGCLYHVQPGLPGEPLNVTFEICEMHGWPLHPISLQPLPDGWVAFTHRGCGPGCSGPAPGLYYLHESQFRPVALLHEAEGTTRWTTDGAAFLYLDATGRPIRLGRVDGGGFWNVTEILAGGTHLRWNQLTLVTPEPGP